MKLKRAVFGLVVFLAACGALTALGADSETDAFIKEVTKTARSDADRMTMLAEAAALTEDNKTLRIALLEKALEYGAKGARTADDYKKLQSVIGGLLQADPDRKAHWLSQKAAIYRRLSLRTRSLAEKRQLLQASVDALLDAGRISASADDWKQAVAIYKQARTSSQAGRLPSFTKIVGLQRSAGYILENQNQIGELVATLKKSPDDFKARSELVKKLVVVMDDPEEAMKHINEDVDQLYRTFVPMAVKDLSELPADSCKALGDWYYKELSKTAVGIAKVRMLRRAASCYQQALSLSDSDDLASAALKMNLSRIAASLKSSLDSDPLQCPWCSDTGRRDCRACEGSGLDKCRYCTGTGRVKCTTCGGTWRRTCSRCKGRGKIASSHTRHGGLIYKRYTKCTSCRGTGVTHRHKSSSYSRPGPCPTCGRQSPEKLRGTLPCKYCKGTGRYGTCKSCRGAKTVECRHSSTD